MENKIFKRRDTEYVEESIENFSAFAAPLLQSFSIRSIT
jgi:hypothetical protein